MHVDSCTCLYSIDSSLPPGEGQMENLQIKVHFCNLTQNIVVTLHYLSSMQVLFGKAMDKFE